MKDTPKTKNDVHTATCPACWLPRSVCDCLTEEDRHPEELPVAVDGADPQALACLRACERTGAVVELFVRCIGMELHGFGTVEFSTERDSVARITVALDSGEVTFLAGCVRRVVERYDREVGVLVDVVVG